MRILVQLLFFVTTAISGLFEGAVLGRYLLNRSHEAPQTRGYTGFFTGAFLGFIVGGIVAGTLLRRLSTTQLFFGIGIEVLMYALTMGGLYIVTQHLGLSW